MVIGAVALTLIASATLSRAQRNRTVAAARSQTSNDTALISSTHQVSVVATGISVRALAVEPNDSHAVLYLTNASAPNQIFQLTLAASSAAANSGLSSVAGTGAPGSLGDGGLATSAELNLDEHSLIRRSAMAVSADGTIYVADSGNSTIRAIAGKASSEPGVIRSIAGRWATGQDIPLVEPMGIALDGVGDLFIADRAAGTIDLIEAKGSIETLAHVTAPAIIAATLDGGTVFVASPDTGALFSITTQTHEIRNLAGFLGPTIVEQTAGSSPCGSATSAPNEQVCPAGLAVDTAGDLFISDAHSGRILRLEAKTFRSSTIASGLNQPGALAIDASGTLYAAEQRADRIVAFAQVGTSQGSLSLAPASAAYGNEPVGGQTSTQSFTVSNISTTAITGLSVPQTTAPADFTLETNSCTTMLAPNSSCTLSIAFTPTTAGPRSDTLTVTDSNSADLASTALSGTGDDYQLQLANGQLSSISVQAGTAGTFNLQVVPDNVFSGTVTLVCPNNLPTNTTCTFSPSTVNVSPGTPAPFSVTFQTTGVVNPLGTWISRIRLTAGHLPPFSTLLAFGMVMVLLGAAHRIRWMTTVALFFIALTLVACSKGRSAVAIGATPAGTSTMAVTGKAQNASRALTITLNVVQE